MSSPSDRARPDSPRVLITAGPTHEPIDAVRYIGNRSSGRMGMALAKAAIERGWRTTLLLGPVAFDAGARGGPGESSPLRVERFRTAEDLRALLRREWPRHDLLIMAAAVADWRVANVQRSKRLNVQMGETKLKREAGRLVLELEPTPDLLGELAAVTRPDQTVIGFALEPADRMLESAREKLARKKLDAIVANPLETMDSARVSAVLMLRDGREIEGPHDASKDDFAPWLLHQLATLASIS